MPDYPSCIYDTLTHGNGLERMFVRWDANHRPPLGRSLVVTFGTASSRRRRTHMNYAERVVLLELYTNLAVTVSLKEILALSNAFLTRHFIEHSRPVWANTQCWCY